MKNWKDDVKFSSENKKKVRHMVTDNIRLGFFFLSVMQLPAGKVLITGRPEMIFSSRWKKIYCVTIVCPEIFLCRSINHSLAECPLSKMPSSCMWLFLVFDARILIITGFLFIRKPGITFFYTLSGVKIYNIYINLPILIPAMSKWAGIVEKRSSRILRTVLETTGFLLCLRFPWKTISLRKWEKLTRTNCNNNNNVVPLARISLTLSRHFSLSLIASGKSSGLHPVSSHICCMYVRAGRPAFARPYVGVHRSTSLMSSSLLLQQCPACLVRLTGIVCVMGSRWPYSWCLVGCCRQDLFNIARNILL